LQWFDWGTSEGDSVTDSSPSDGSESLIHELAHFSSDFQGTAVRGILIRNDAQILEDGAYDENHFDHDAER
jgi:hypothetical protein